MTKCEFCGKPLDEENTHYMNETTMCEDCLEEKTVLCQHCGERIWRDDAIREDNYTLCNHCYEYDFIHCSDCGRLICEDDACYDEDSERDYCSSCYDRLNDSSIESYNYKPSPIFYGEGDLFIGVELEIDDGGECSDNADTLMYIANRDDEHLYCKHDGSLEDGFELVSHPMTLAYHTENMNWQEVFRKAIKMEYRSHDTDTCGLHCHVNRSAFGESEEAQEAVIARIVFFVENHWNELLKFSRRTVDNINRWASRYGISENTANTYKNAKDKSYGRYVAVNLCNYATVEFRLFRGTLNYNTFLATLQLVDELCHVCKDRSDTEIEGLSWSEFVGNIKGKDELIKYLKSKRLYINEITEESEEI